MQIGIIGTGSMGGMLAVAFSKIRNHDVYIYNRTKEKALALATDYKHLTVCDSLMELVLQSKLILLCTKLNDGREILRHIGHEFAEQQIILTSISNLPIAEFEQYTSAKVGKFIPSLTQCVDKGVILFTPGSRITPTLEAEIHAIFSRISKPVTVAEQQIRICSDLTSCGPAFLSHLALTWSHAAAQCGDISREKAECMISETLIGLAYLLQQGITFQDVMDQIMIPGGVTERGISSLGESPEQMFRTLHLATQMCTHGSKK